MNNINKALSLTLTALVSTAAVADDKNTNEFSFGGRVEAQGFLTDSLYNDEFTARLHGQGKYQLNDAITAVGKVELESIFPNSESNRNLEDYTRYAYAGVETAYGALTYGTQDNAVTYLTDFTDMAEVYSGYTNTHIAASDDRAKNTLLYSVTKGDFKFNASANFEEFEKGGGVMVAYQLRPDVEVSAGYAATESTVFYADSSEVYMLGARYTKDGFLLSGLAQKGTVFDDDFNAVDAFASYGFGKNTVSLSYNYLSAAAKENVDVNFLAFEYGRYFGGVALYTGYKVAFGTDTSARVRENADEFMFGARYAF